MPEIRRTKAVLSRQQWKEMQKKRQEDGEMDGEGREDTGSAMEVPGRREQLDNLTDENQ